MKRSVDRRGWFQIVGGVFACALVMSVASFAPGAQAAGDERWGGSLIVGIAGDPYNLNVDLPNFSTHAEEICKSIFDQLVGWNRNWRIIPRLARQWNVSKDATIYTFRLDRRAKWHDGKPVTSADVKWTFEKITSGKGWGAEYLKDVASIETPDDATVRITLSRGNSGFLYNVAQTGLSILPKHLYIGTDWANNPYNLKPIGSGPFKFVKYEKGSYVELAANKDYHGGRPFIDRLVFRVVPDAAVAVRQIEAGELDLSTQYAPFGDVPRLRSSKKVQLLDYTYPVIQWLGFKLSKAPFNDLRVRQAIAAGLDRDELNRKGNNGVGIPSQYLYLTGHWATDTSVTLPAYNAERARQLLKEAGYGDGFRTSLLVYQGYGAPEVGQVIRELLGRIGINVTLDIREWASYVDNGVKQKDFDLFYGTGFTGPDPSMLQTFVGTAGFQNVGGYSNAQVDALFVKAQGAADQAQAKVLYGQLEKILAQELPRLPLFDRKVVFPANPSFRDYWQQTSLNAVAQPERAYDRVWWMRGRARP